MIKFSYTILYVKDVNATLSFYEHAFDLKRKFITPANDYGELLTGSTVLAFASHKLAGGNLTNGYLAGSLNQKPFGFEIGFATKDVDAFLKKAVAAGGAIEAESKTKPWGQVVAYIRDPDGFLIEICTPVD